MECAVPVIVVAVMLAAASGEDSRMPAGPPRGATGTAGAGPHADPVIQRALVVLGQPMNPIKVVGLQDIREMFARMRAGAPPAGLNAFRATGDANVYVNRDSPVYERAARLASALDWLVLAATLVHEQVHNTDGEFAACRRQSDFVRSRLHTVPARQQQAAARYLRGLDARAHALGRIERTLRERATRASR